MRFTIRFSGPLFLCSVIFLLMLSVPRIVKAQGGGILINTNGVVKTVFQKEKSNALLRKKQKAYVKSHLSGELTAKSAMRKVSLVRLEQKLQQLLDNKTPLPDDVRALAGLQRIDYVILYPEENDIVIAGPAEGFAPNGVGRVVGINTGRPVLQLDDLFVALRTSQTITAFGCSIDPVKKRLADLQTYVSRNSRAASPSVVKERYQRMARVLGNQTIRTWGVPKESHFAKTMVEADILMKRMSVGLEPSKVSGFRTHLSMLRGDGNSLQRWWFAPLYDPFQTNETRTIFQFSGQRLQLLSQDEIANAGTRSNAATTRLSTAAYSKQFTKAFPLLAEKHATFAEMQNLTDLVILCALIQKESLAQKANWEMSLLLDSKQLPHARFEVAKEVPSCFNTKSLSNRMVVGLIGGGVVLNSKQIHISKPKTETSQKELKQTYSTSKQIRVTEKHSWWWD